METRYGTFEFKNGYPVGDATTRLLDMQKLNRAIEVYTTQMMRVSEILDDAKAVAATVKAETDRVDNAIRSTMHRVDDTVDRVRSNVRSRTSRIVGLVRGARVVLETMLQSRAA